MKLGDFIRFGVVTNQVADTAQFPRTQLKYFNQVENVTVVYPYGYAANAPLNTLSVAVNVGSSDDTLSFPMSGNERKKDLLPGEVAVENQLTGSFFKFTENGDVEIYSQNEININNKGTGKINIDEEGKLFIGNSNEELLTLMKEFIDEVSAILTNTSIGPQPPINKAAFISLSARIDSLIP